MALLVIYFYTIKKINVIILVYSNNYYVSELYFLDE